MIVRELPSGQLMVNTYLVYDEVNKKGFIVDPGGYDRKTMDIKQKTAYEIDHCDWSSDVCSSDLDPPSDRAYRPAV